MLSTKDGLAHLSSPLYSFLFPFCFRPRPFFSLPLPAWQMFLFPPALLLLHGQKLNVHLQMSGDGLLRRQAQIMILQLTAVLPQSVQGKPSTVSPVEIAS